MYKLIAVIELLLQSSFRNPTEFYYNWIIILYMMYDVSRLGSTSWAVYVFMYSDIFYIQWNHLAKKDLWNKVYKIRLFKQKSKKKRREKCAIHFSDSYSVLEVMK
jgi:hypothetical protein